ncbi:MAG: DNA translocase FtsK 4TM domain-containing protein, partial [Bifidobacteriaceae bacterium]|nr:DNA translocase FtsK 4TM domain-containing protein [Bifidobacteriaceae bacterium]
MPNDKTTVMLPKNKRNNQQQNQRANSNDSNDSKPRIPRTPKNIRNDETIIAKNNRTGKYRNSQNTSTKYSPKNSPKNDKIVPDYSLTDDEYYDDYQYDNIYEAVLSSPLLRDFIGVLFIIFSIILISATWFNASGSVLNFFEFITRFFVGNFAFAMPIFLVYLSYRIMSKRWDLYENLRALGGVMLFIISIDSYIQIGSKLPTIKNNGLETLQYHGGGLFGFIVANPLAAGVTAPVAAIIITVLLIFSLLIFTGKTFVEIWISFTELLNHLRRDEFDTGLLDGEDDGYSSGDDHSIIPSAGTNKFSKTNSDDIFPAGISTDADFNNAKIDKHGQKTSLIVGKLSDVAGGIVTKIKLKNLTDDNAISLPDSLENMSDSGDLIYTESDISTSGKLIKKSKGKHVKDGLFGYNSKNQEEADPDDLIETDRILIEGVNTSFVSNESDPYFPKDIAQPIEIGGVKTLKYGDYLDNYDPEKKKQKLAEVIVKNNKNTGLNTFSFDDENPENLDENIADDPEKTVAYKPDFVQDVNANNT